MKSSMNPFLLACAATIAAACPLTAANTQPAVGQPAEYQRPPEPETPPDRSNTREDLKITQAIRLAIAGDRALINASKKVTIVTAYGDVTLLGKVDLSAHKARIEELAVTAAGKGKVVNQIELTTGAAK